MIYWISTEAVSLHASYFSSILYLSLSHLMFRNVVWGGPTFGSMLSSTAPKQCTVACAASKKMELLRCAWRHRSSEAAWGIYIYDIILLSIFINSFNVSVLNWTGLNWINGKELEDLETSRSQPVFAFLYGMVAPPGKEHQWSTSSWQSASNSHRLHSSRPQVPRFHSARWNLG